MPLFLAPLLLKLSPVGRFLKSIPRWVWLAIAAALLLFLGVRWHNGQIKDAEKRGADRAYAAVEKKAREIEAKANATADKIRSKTDETARAIAADADVIRMSGPGKARACPVPQGSSRRETAGGQGSPAVDQVPDTGGVDLIALPFAPTVRLAEVCDLNRGEVLAWREWHSKLSANP
jgi:hypothetical protein